MFDLIAKIFVKNHNDVKNPAVRTAYGTMTSIFGIVVNVLLFAVKFIVGTVFMSVSIRGDAINNLSDALSSVISLISFKMSQKPADREHPFGHARIEYVASMIVSFLIIHISIEQFGESFDKILNPVPSQFSYLTIAVLAVSILAKLWMYLFNRAMGKKIGSLVMQANAADSISDVLGTSAVLISVLVAEVIKFNIDGYMGIIVGVLILISGLKILNDAKNSLLGEAPDNELVAEISSDVLSHPEVLGIHDIVVHNYGAGMHFATLHVEVDGKADLFETHDVVDNIERELSAKYNIHCSCHLDPIVTDDEKVTSLRTLAAQTVASIDDRLSIHDFRMVAGVTHTNLIFDVVVPFEYESDCADLQKQIDEKIKKIDNSYFTVITIDRA